MFCDGRVSVQALSGPAAQGGMVEVQRHALDEHVPALSGPLVVACSEGALNSFLDWAQEDDEAASLCAIWCGCLPAVLLCTQAEQRGFFLNGHFVSGSTPAEAMRALFIIQCELIEEGHGTAGLVER